MMKLFGLMLALGLGCLSSASLAEGEAVTAVGGAGGAGQVLEETWQTSAGAPDYTTPAPQVATNILGGELVDLSADLSDVCPFRSTGLKDADCIQAPFEYIANLKFDPDNRDISIHARYEAEVSWLKGQLELYLERCGDDREAQDRAKKLGVMLDMMDKLLAAQWDAMVAHYSALDD